MSFRLTLSSSSRALAVTTVFSLAACSAIVSPDVGSLPPPLGGLDSGPVIDTDLGPRDGGPGMIDMGAMIPCSGATRCVGTELIECIGGTERRTLCALGCAGGPATRCAQFVPSNVSADSFAIGTEDLEVGDGAMRHIDTDACSLDGIVTHVVAQAGGLSLCVLTLRNLRVRAGGILSASGARPLVVLASADIDVEGTIDVSARQGRAGAGGGAGGLGDMLNGEGVGNGTAGGHLDPLDDGGGGGGALCGGGGSGGQGGSATGGAGGGAVTTELTPLLGGSGGGRGRGTVLATTSLAGYGGAGGGALQMSAFGMLRVSGDVLAGGGGGGGGGVGTSGGLNWGSGGGAGSGGGVLLEAATVRLAATARIVTAGGGGGGAAAGGRSGSNGGDGVGTPQSAGGVGGGGPFDAPGGDGALRMLDGADGRSNLMSTANGGGGGGGSGCVIVRNGDGMLPGAAATATPPGSLRVLLARRR